MRYYPLRENTPTKALRSYKSQCAAACRQRHPFQPSPASDGDLQRSIELIHNYNLAGKIGSSEVVLAVAIVKLTLLKGNRDALLPLTAIPKHAKLSERQCLISKTRLLRCGLLHQTDDPRGSVFSINLTSTMEKNYMEIVAKYKTFCRACKMAIPAGERIQWAGKGTDQHITCPAVVPAATKPAPPPKSTYDRILELRSKCESGKCRFEDRGLGYIGVQECRSCATAKDAAKRLAQWKATATPEELASRGFAEMEGTAESAV